MFLLNERQCSPSMSTHVYHQNRARFRKSRWSNKESRRASRGRSIVVSHQYRRTTITIENFMSLSAPRTPQVRERSHRLSWLWRGLLLNTTTCYNPASWALRAVHYPKWSTQRMNIGTVPCHSWRNIMHVLWRIKEDVESPNVNRQRSNVYWITCALSLNMPVSSTYSKLNFHFSGSVRLHHLFDKIKHSTQDCLWRKHKKK